MSVNLNKALTIAGAAAALIVSAGSIIGGINWYVNTKYVPRTELEAHYVNLQQNNEVILSVLKSIGTSFYDSTIIDLDTAIVALEELEDPTLEQSQQLDTLKLILSKLNRERNILENMSFEKIDIGPVD